MKREIGLIYFSASNNTANMADFIKEKLENIEKKILVEKISITSHSERQAKIHIDKYDAIIFGFPIHEWRAPNLVRNWLKTLNGKGKKCSVFFTYGGINPGASHYDIKQILDRSGFQLVSTAEFVAKHTYNCGGWSVMENRPNESDFKIAENYVLKTYMRFIHEDNGLVDIKNPNISERMFLNIEKTVKKGLKPPSREGKGCRLCGICASLCPANAIDHNSGETDPNTCIRCYRCFSNCPENVLKIDDLYPIFLKFKKVGKFPKDENNIISKFFL